MVSQEQESHEILKAIPKYPLRINARDRAAQIQACWVWVERFSLGQT